MHCPVKPDTGHHTATSNGPLTVICDRRGGRLLDQLWTLLTRYPRSWGQTQPFGPFPKACPVPPYLAVGFNLAIWIKPGPWSVGHWNSTAFEQWNPETGKLWGPIPQSGPLQVDCVQVEAPATAAPTLWPTAGDCIVLCHGFCPHPKILSLFWPKE